MKFLMKLFSRCGLSFLIAFPILVNSQIFTSLNANQETELGSEIDHCGDSTPSSVDFRTFPFNIGMSPLLHQINSFLKIEQS